MIPASRLHPRDHIYTHILPCGTNINLASALLQDLCNRARAPVYNVQLNSAEARKFISRNIVDMDRVRTFNKRTLDPVVHCLWEGHAPAADRADAFLCDGHHRYVYAHTIHMQTIPSYLIPYAIWQEFLITGLPDFTREQLLSTPNLERTY